MIARLLPFRAVVLLTLSPACAVPALAQAPKVSFTADLTFDYGPGQKFTASFYYSPGRQRMDYSRSRSRRIDIVFADSRQVIRLDINRKQFCRYRVKHLPAWYLGVASPGAKRTRRGPETVGNLEAIRYRVESRTPYGDQFYGAAWIDSDGVVLKMEGMHVRGKAQRPVTVTVANLRKTKLKDALFKIPDGFRKVRCRAGGNRKAG